MATIMECAVSAILWRFTLFVVLILSVLLSWASSTRASVPPPNYAASPSSAPSPLFHNASAVTKILSSAGYNLFAHTLEATAESADVIFQSNRAATATLFAPSDAVFAPLARTAPLPSAALLLHSARCKATWLQSEALRRALSCPRSSPDAAAAALAASVSPPVTAPLPTAPPFATPTSTRTPLSPSTAWTASPCPTLPPSPAALLSNAVRVLQGNGYGAVATAMHMMAPELLQLDKITIFAPADVALFGSAGGSSFDFRYHVVARRLPMLDLLRLPLGARLDTLAAGKSIVITGTGGGFHVDNVSLTEPEIFHNEIMMVHSVALPLQPSDAHPFD